MHNDGTNHTQCIMTAPYTLHGEGTQHKEHESTDSTYRGVGSGDKQTSTTDRMSGSSEARVQSLVAGNLYTTEHVMGMQTLCRISNGQATRKTINRICTCFKSNPTKTAVILQRATSVTMTCIEHGKFYGFKVRFI